MIEKQSEQGISNRALCIKAMILTAMAAGMGIMFSVML